MRGNPLRNPLAAFRRTRSTRYYIEDHGTQQPPRHSLSSRYIENYSSGWQPTDQIEEVEPPQSLTSPLHYGLPGWQPTEIEEVEPPPYLTWQPTQIEEVEPPHYLTWQPTQIEEVEKENLHARSSRPRLSASLSHSLLSSLYSLSSPPSRRPEPLLTLCSLPSRATSHSLLSAVPSHFSLSALCRPEPLLTLCSLPSRATPSHPAVLSHPQPPLPAPIYFSHGKPPPLRSPSLTDRIRSDQDQIN
uniref:Uncharacterized protein n=1 Tax=Fagus sylvatica TaxID=28930 RepID=A0A2N9FY97_FAGSY